MHRVFASIGAFIGRANGRDYRLIKDIAPKIRCDGFEMMFNSDWYQKTDRLTGFLNDIGVDFPTFHVDKKIGELLAMEDFQEAYRLFGINCDIASKIGSHILILHLWNGRISDSNIKANFSAYPKLEKAAADRGLILTSENVVASHNTPLALLNKLIETCPDALFTYDTKMADFDNENVIAFDGRHSWLWDRVKHVHLNDRLGPYHDWNSIRALHLGRGQIDFDFVFSGLKSIGYSGDFTIESTCLSEDGTIKLDDMNSSINKLREYIKSLEN